MKALESKDILLQKKTLNSGGLGTVVAGKVVRILNAENLKE